MSAAHPTAHPTAQPGDLPVTGQLTLAGAVPGGRAPTLADYPQLAGRRAAVTQQAAERRDAVAEACALLLRWQRLDQLAFHAVEMRAALERLGGAERQALPAREGLHAALGTLAEEARKRQAALIPPPDLPLPPDVPVFTPDPAPDAP